MYRLKLTARAKRELNTIKKIHRETIRTIFEEIKENPFIGKPLSRELLGRYTYKIGNYRIVYKIQQKDNIIHILTASHRSTIYK